MSLYKRIPEGLYVNNRGMHIPRKDSNPVKEPR